MTLLKEGTMTTDSPIEIVPAEWDTPAGRRFLAADARVGAAQAAVAAADERLEAARLADGTESTAASRSELTKARRQRTAAGDTLIAAEEEMARAGKLVESEDQAETGDTAELVALQRRTRAALGASRTVVGLYAQLISLASRAALPPQGPATATPGGERLPALVTTLGPAHAEALGRFAEAARALSFQQDQAQWPKPSSDHREVSR